MYWDDEEKKEGNEFELTEKEKLILTHKNSLYKRYNQTGSLLLNILKKTINTDSGIAT